MGAGASSCRSARELYTQIHADTHTTTEHNRVYIEQGRDGVEAAARSGLLHSLSCSADRVSAIPTTHRFADQSAPKQGHPKYIALAFCVVRFA